MAQAASELSITFVLDPTRVSKLRSSFPEFEDIQEVATALAPLMTNEFIDLLAGEKRYMSLSHQYVEWLQQVYEVLLPEEEYSYDRLYNEFNFPPGTAQYLARVLRERQHSTLHEKAKSRLREQISREIEEYDGLPEDAKPAAKPRSPRLAVREYSLLVMAVDRLAAKGEAMEWPRITSRSSRFVVCTHDVDQLRKVLPEIERL